jgi:DMSO/TMAO reductase YedYZ molybdopterin-dependent catalytic subunit
MKWEADHNARTGAAGLVTTVKYGIKSIKRIGRITFTDQRPRDFWSEQGYDWYAGLCS